MFHARPLLRLPVITMLWLFSFSAAAETVDFELPGLDGKHYRLSDYRGKWVLVNYWATWCPPCREELPELEVFHNNHKDTDAVVLGVAMERIEMPRLKAFVDEQFLSYPILIAKPAARTELGRVPGLPTSFLVNPEGKLVARQVGPLTLEDLESFITSTNE
ncbi:MAG: thiol-disulfide oxidoreductase [gamma proteobacterium symbiont of Ctena orbiculata]|uniref:TlpA family protein disulfide reductase n=1 Tax=Candidatus Thiodiazotropha taylori TaxID=2792791 RepID=A0A944MBL9_9GAMM|nr:TlpA family protein disulfide reductase [Candidatus Thiodiazotropha taylori]PUB89966.1 MAG: TlpA family protein disulfide reductase [gamma proteobacterium symbiont of Ctena orbiculata]MBT2988913.1 TlpA family protein disulfide reductase [Candidatus Thiodiazotropha taylori]MBT2996441.1 TlpA family protein disulfide reductase [Candidatus Thiodiazotropha taylori]MBT3000125.1 TlpA family protein disulfide reductase [Candidatus Thiodiazotropha taylori]